MDSILLDQADEVSPETSTDSSVPPDSPDRNEIFGEPLVHPRVGDEYQVEIPCLLSKSELHQLMMNPAESQFIVDSSHSFLMGLPVPLMRIYNSKNPVKDEKMECTNTHEVLTNRQGESDNIMCKKEPVFEVGNVYSIVPDQSTRIWSDFETECFLLGLYIFGKDLLQVKKFIDCEDMGKILSFYYGRFYGSAGYQKWSECRKARNRKCVLGHRFFTGYRQQELFSRLLPRLCDEAKIKLPEASRAFAEGRTTLEEYVSKLKALVGIRALVEAVGIGKGKDDLTTLFLDSSKNTQAHSNHHPEIPSGKACSSLTCPEIVKYLTGDFRLSKARSNDLFWEAVWPRLLARGWHSEQPMGDCYTSSKHCLVFLMPGIKKFSRRKLTKGDHYFDSVTDVLAKVASEPELIELEDDETKPTSNTLKGEENGWSGVQVKSSDDDYFTCTPLQHCYLKPRVSSGLSNLTKFTIVDTSLADEDNPCKVRELRSLPLETRKPSILSKNSKVVGVSLKSGDGNLSTDHKSRDIKHQFSRRVKFGVSECSGLVKKKRRVTSCVEGDVAFVLSLPARKKKVLKATTSKNTVSRIKLPLVQKISSANSSVASASDRKIVEETTNGNHVDRIMHGKMKVIDLNLPQVQYIFEEGEAETRQYFDLEKPKQKLEEGNNSNEHFDTKKLKQELKGGDNPKKHSDLEKSKQKLEEGDNSTKHSDLGKSKQKLDAEDNTKKHSDLEKSKQKLEEGDNSSKHSDLEKLKQKLDAGDNAKKHSDLEKSKQKLEEGDNSSKHSDLEKLKQKLDAGDNTKKHSDLEKPKQKLEEGDNSSKHYDLEKLKQKLDVGDNTKKHSDLDEAKKCEPVVSNCETQQPRRQSTRSRPLTTKALEALEIGFLNPVRHSRKRLPSTSATQEQKPKRSRKRQSKEPMLPGIKESKLDMLGSSSIGPILVKKEAPSGEVLRFSLASCTPKAS